MSVNIGRIMQSRAPVSPALECYVEPENGVRVSYADLDRYSNTCTNMLREQYS